MLQQLKQIPKVALCDGGPEVSSLILGVWRLMDWKLSADELVTFIEECVNLGLTTFDHADIYGDYLVEETFGKALQMAPDLKKHIQIVTKCGIKLLSKNRPEHQIKSYDCSPAHIVKSVEHSLSALGVDRIDVLLLHRPSPVLHAEQVAETFASLRKSGKVAHFGVSNFGNHDFELLEAAVDQPLVTNQVEISPLQLVHFQNGVLSLQQKLKRKPMAWSPTGGGRLFSPQSDQERRVADVLGLLSRKYGCAYDQLIYAWLLHHPSGILPILGTQRLERIRGAIGALDLSISDEDWFKVWEASNGRRVP